MYLFFPQAGPGWQKGRDKENNNRGGKGLNSP